MTWARTVATWPGADAPNLILESPHHGGQPRKSGIGALCETGHPQGLLRGFAEHGQHEIFEVGQPRLPAQ